MDFLKRIKLTNLIIFILLIIGAISFFTRETEPVPILQTTYAEDLEQIQPSLNLRIVDGKLKPNTAIYDELLVNISPDEIFPLINSFKKIYNFKYARPGHEYKLFISPQKTVHKFIYKTGPFDRYIAVRTSQNVYSTFKETVYINKKTEAKEFTIDTSFYQAVVDGGEKDWLVMEFAEIFAWDIDFYLYPRKGDKIKILFEKYEKDGKFVRYGNILGGQYISKNKTYTAFRYNDGRRVGFYDKNGSPLQKMFLRMPVKFGMMTSGFTFKRFHPVLKRSRRHDGIDYGARHGTPIHATADGYVTFSGWNGGYGKMVKLRHANGYSTGYAHCSNLLVRQGQYVKQGQTIAKIGSTGISTGPHVHYEVRVNNRAINPSSIKSTKKPALRGAALVAFKQTANERLAQTETLLNPPAPVVVAEVKAKPETASFIDRFVRKLKQII